MIIQFKFATEEDMQTWDSTLDDIKTGKIKQYYCEKWERYKAERKDDGR